MENREFITLKEVRALLEANDMYLLKKWGQNYLFDHNILKKIADQCLDTPAELVVEIGTGMGMLTQFLVNNGPTVYTCEIDQRLFDILQTQYDLPRVEAFPDQLENRNLMVTGDALKQNWDNLLDYPVKYAIVGNIPYQITSPLIFRFMDLYLADPEKFQHIVFVIQKEVAVRLAASEGSKEYGLLSALLQIFFDVSICFHIPKGCFFPAPKIDSTCIRLKPKRALTVSQYKRVKALVKQAFANRRKKVYRNIKSLITDEKWQQFLTEFGYRDDIRAERISPEGFLFLAQS